MGLPAQRHLPRLTSVSVNPQASAAFLDSVRQTCGRGCDNHAILDDTRLCFSLFSGAEAESCRLDYS